MKKKAVREKKRRKQREARMKKMNISKRFQHPMDASITFTVWIYSKVHRMYLATVATEETTKVYSSITWL